MPKKWIWFSASRVTIYVFIIGALFFIVLFSSSEHIRCQWPFSFMLRYERFCYSFPIAVWVYVGLSVGVQTIVFISGQNNIYNADNGNRCGTDAVRICKMIKIVILFVWIINKSATVGLCLYDFKCRSATIVYKVNHSNL